VVNSDLALVRRFWKNSALLDQYKGRLAFKLDYIGDRTFGTLGNRIAASVLDKGQKTIGFGVSFIHPTRLLPYTVCLIALVIWEWFRRRRSLFAHVQELSTLAERNLMMFCWDPVVQRLVLIAAISFSYSLLVTSGVGGVLRFLRREALSARRSHHVQADHKRYKREY